MIYWVNRDGVKMTSDFGEKYRLIQKWGILLIKRDNNVEYWRLSHGYEGPIQLVEKGDDYIFKVDLKKKAITMCHGHDRLERAQCKYKNQLGKLQKISTIFS